MGPADEEELKNELKNLMKGDSDALDEFLKLAAQEKEDGDEALKRKLAARKAAMLKKRQQAQKDIEDELKAVENMDVEDQILMEKEAEERLMEEEKREIENLKNIVEEAKESEDKSKQLASAGINTTVDSQVSDGKNALKERMRKAFLAKVQTVEREEAELKKIELERKNEARKKMNEIQENFDVGMEKASLMANLGGLDDALHKALAEDEALQEKRNAEKRALLLARRRNKNKQKKEEDNLKDQIELMKVEEEEKERISEKYIKDLFKKREGDTTARKLSDEEREKRLQVLNEYLSDQFLERSAGLMGKQYTEKEQMLKLTNQKYLDQAAAETEAVKS